MLENHECLIQKDGVVAKNRTNLDANSIRISPRYFKCKFCIIFPARIPYIVVKTNKKSAQIFRVGNEEKKAKCQNNNKQQRN